MWKTPQCFLRANASAFACSIQSGLWKSVGLEPSWGSVNQHSAPRTHTTIHDYPNKSGHTPHPPLFWAPRPFFPRRFSSSQATLQLTQDSPNTTHTHTHALLQIKMPRLIEQYSSNGFIHRWFYLCRHKHTCSLSAPTKRSCSPLFLRKLAENLLNPSLLPLLCCVSAGARSRRASETEAIRTWAGPLGIRPFSIEANKAGYRKKKKKYKEKNIGTAAVFGIEGDLTALNRIKELQDVWGAQIWTVFLKEFSLRGLTTLTTLPFKFFFNASKKKHNVSNPNWRFGRGAEELLDRRKQ